MFGYNRLGYGVGQYLKSRKKKFLVVDYNPEVAALLDKDKINHIYGDAGDVELIEDLNLSEVKVVVSTISSFGIDMFLIKKLKEINRNLRIIVSTEDVDQALKFYTAGADYVIMPRYLSAYDTNNLISLYDTDKEKIDRERFNHIDYLKSLKLKKGIGSNFDFLDV